jgi:hypothetical protein
VCISIGMHSNETRFGAIGYSGRWKYVLYLFHMTDIGKLSSLVSHDWFTWA